MKIKDEISGLMDDWHVSAHRHRGVLGRGWELRFPAQNCNAAPPPPLLLKYGSVWGALLLGQLYPPPLVLAWASPPLGRGYPPPRRGGKGKLCGWAACWPQGWPPCARWLLGGVVPSTGGLRSEGPSAPLPKPMVPACSGAGVGAERGAAPGAPVQPQQQLAPAVTEAFVATLTLRSPLQQQISLPSW